MPNLLRTIIEGHVGKVDRKKDKNNKDYVIFTVAVNKKDKDGKEMPTTWVTVFCYGYAMSDAAGLQKGMGVHVEGEPWASTYTRQGQEPTAQINIRASSVWYRQSAARENTGEGNQSPSNDLPPWGT
jgi:single-stranded DNA-binding protein